MVLGGSTGKDRGGIEGLLTRKRGKTTRTQDLDAVFRGRDALRPGFVVLRIRAKKED
jgi:hypothetical protein